MVAAAVPSSADAGDLPTGFEETTAFSGLQNPTVLRFAPDGEVYVAEKGGRIYTYDDLSDTSGTLFADLRTQVHNYWDRGLLGMALDPSSGPSPTVYVLYARDAAIGGTAPRWNDTCPTPPGPTSDGCVVGSRLSRLVPQAGGLAQEQVLIEDWCQQYPSHSTGSLELDASGALYASGGDGASFTFTDWGQDGNPVNPCGDPHTGASPTPPAAEGGALRSQDVRTMSDPVTLDGSMIRIDPSDGSAISTNPMFSSTDSNARRIVASGLRNPFRFDVAEDGAVWVGDVGWNSWEEINRLPPSGFHNFGWPCYEGAGPQPGYDGAGLNLCESLYAAPPETVTEPYYAYHHNAEVVEDEDCPTGSSSIAGMRFYDGPDASSFPGPYESALFFADYSRDCIWVMHAGADGQPDPDTVATFDAGASNPVWLEVGPDGALYYADFDGGRIRRVQSTAANGSPTAVLEAAPMSGPAPLTVDLDGTGSADPDEDSLAYAWDLDDDGDFDDSSAATLSHVFDASGSYDVSLRVSDGRGGSDAETVTIDVDNGPPVPTIDTPSSTLRWGVGDEIDFSGSARDPDEGALPPSSMRWRLKIDHCPSTCHQHPVEYFAGIDSGSFFAPDHEYRSDLLLRLTAVDSQGATGTTVLRLAPRSTILRLTSDPEGAQLAIDGLAGAAPLRLRVIEGSAHTISAPSPQLFGTETLDWARWSDGGAASHSIVADPGLGALRARFR
jgi:glucose/arabinose dehydrogenase